MLFIELPGGEIHDEKTNRLTSFEARTVQMEHSLGSVSKWEALWGIPFLSDAPRTPDQTYSYLECMVINGDLPKDQVRLLPDDTLKTIVDYIGSSQTATTFVENPNKRPSREIITSELIYYWMVQLNIPFETDRWHLNRLLTLIRVTNIKNTPAKKQSKTAVLARYNEINAQRRAQMGTAG